MAEQAVHDLVIKGGRLIDPSQSLDGPWDVAFAGGKVGAVAADIPAASAREVIDARGLIVTPGLIDLHVHAYQGGSCYGVDPDYACLRSGVTTAVDAGSAGARTFPAFRRYVLERCATRLLALVNISTTGMIALNVREVDDMRLVSVADAVRCGLDNREYVVGVKARLSNSGGHVRDDVDLLKRAIEAAEAIGGFVMIHVKQTTSPLEKLTAMLRPGDVVTHAFHGKPVGVLDDAGRVIDALREDQRRGVVFDVGHGKGSFSWRVAEAATAQGFFPDTISSDLYNDNIEGPVFDLVTTMSKYLYLGMTLEEVVRQTTQAPARVLGMAERIGTLRPGAEGDAAVLRVEDWPVDFRDARGDAVQGDRRIAHVATVKGGKRYRPWDGPAR